MITSSVIFKITLEFARWNKARIGFV